MERLTHYTLPRITSGLYDKEAISSIHLTKEIAVKINELVDAYNALSNERVTKALEQDGKIDKAVLFMKDNIANTLHEIFTIMKNTGDIEAILHEQIPAILRDEYTFVALPTETVNGVNKVKDVRFGYGNVRRYGGIGDGKADDTQALNDTAVICRSNGFVLYGPSGDYHISGDIDFTNLTKVSFDGDIHGTTGKVIVGAVSTTQDSGSFIFNDVPELRIEGMKNADVTFNTVELLSLMADGDVPAKASVRYNTFTGNKATKVTINSTGTAIGWINENVFNVKRIDHIVIDGNYAHNNNHFNHCNLESGKLELLNANNNHFSARGEGGVEIVMGDNVGNNFFEREYYHRHYFGEPIVEDAKGNITYSHIHRLQTEENLLTIDKNHRDHKIGSLAFNSNGTFIPSAFNEIFNSDVVEITGTVAIRAKSSHKVLRVRMNFYDANMNRIKDEDVFTDGRLNLIDTPDWDWQINTNVDNDTVVIYNGTKAKYFTYSVLFGSSVDSMSVSYVTVKLIKYTNTDFVIGNKIKHNVYTQVPSSGYWEIGTILIGAVPRSGGNIGIVCTESGSPGTWKNFGEIKE